MKNVQEPILVHWDSQARQMEWRQRCYIIEDIFERWYYRGKWWLTPNLQGESRIYYRVLCNLRGFQKEQPSRQIGPYSDSVRTRKQAPQRLAAADSKIFEIYCVGAKRWVLSRVVD